MGIYFEEERKKTQWESGQALLHSQSAKKQDHKDGQQENDRESESYRVQNSYGTLRYLKKDKKIGETKEGFAVEAFESPNTRIHTDAEKHLNRKSIRKVKQNLKQTLYASELPLSSQALFLDMRGIKKSADLIQYMKTLIQKQGHQTLQDAFGFLDQETERAELEALKKYQKEDRQSEQGADNKRIDTISSRLRRKEAMERQLQNELQVMLNQHGRKEALEAQKNHAQNESETSDTKQSQNTNKKSDSPRRRFHAEAEVSENDGAILGTDGDEMPQDTDLG